MKYEYKSFNLSALQNEKIKQGKDTLNAFREVLNDIGADGWELIALNGDIIGKKAIE